MLPDIDDGPRRSEDSLALCRLAAELGTHTITATPHVSWTYPNTAHGIAARVDEINRQLHAAEIDVMVLTGAEVAISKAVEMADEELAALRLGGGPWLLAEPPFTPGAASLESMIHTLRARGHNLLLAHPERCPVFLRDRSMLERLVDDGVLVSVTAGAFTGRFGKESMRFAEGLLRDGLVHNVASDAHSTGRRPPGMGRELQEAGFGDQVDWLCDAVPRALLAGTELPPRSAPLPQRKSGLARLFKA